MLKNRWQHYEKYFFVNIPTHHLEYRIQCTIMEIMIPCNVEQKSLGHLFHTVWYFSMKRECITHVSRKKYENDVLH